LHVVGHLTEAVFQTLGPLLETLAAENCAQQLVVIDDATARRLLDTLALDLEIRWIPGPDGLGRHWLVMASLMRQQGDLARLDTLYLHGLMPLLLGAALARRVQQQAGRVLVLPHHSRSLRSMTWLTRPVFWLVQHVVGAGRLESIASVPFDVAAMQRLVKVQARLIEPPVADVFFSIRAKANPQPPLIVGAAMPDATLAVPRFAQFAVLMGAHVPREGFVWLSPVSPEEREVLTASGVRIVERSDDPYVRAEVLSRASLFVLPQAGRTFTMPVAEALAVGVPSLGHAGGGIENLLSHGETGIVAPTVAALAREARDLLAQPQQRAVLAAQSRREAVLRFSDVEFRRHLVAAYRGRH
jgi:hypothetical protein